MATHQDSSDLEGSLSSGLFFPCRYCPPHGKNAPLDSGTILPRGLSDFVSCHAYSKCWNALVGPFMNYITVKIMLPPIVVKFLLSAMEEVDSNVTFRQMVSVLEQHRSLHPPCRPKMHEYYYSVFLETLNSHIFKDQPVAEGFLHLIRKLQVSFSQYKEARPKPKQLVAPTTEKEVMSMLKNTLKSPAKQADEKPNHLKLDIQIFVLRYCTNILLHDFVIRSKTRDQDEPFEQRPLISKIVYGRHGRLGSVNIHCEEIFRLYFSAPKRYSKEVARYVVLLAETVRFHDPTAQPKFPYRGQNVDKFCSKLGEISKDGGRVTEKNLQLIGKLPSNWLKYLVGLNLLTGELINGAHFPKNLSLALKRTRSGK